ncbi:MAG TPA: hypothetical protein VFS31_19560, partial [Chitinophagaceae bacterium]|nr:hypothetical protein [Chitinophagaceae bacterium]
VNDMKRFAAIILAVLYLASSAGAGINLHYCMGKLAGWDWSQSESAYCTHCGMEKSNKKDNGCCKDEHKFVKNLSDQKLAESGFQIILLSGAALVSKPIELPSHFINSVSHERPVGNGPPDYVRKDIYILNRTLLI